MEILRIEIYLTFVYILIRYNSIHLFYNIKRYNMELRIKDVLKEKKVTVVSLAGMIGITQPNMSNIVNGKSAPSLETLDKIADALRVPVTELFERPKSGIASLSCPHCGKSINIKAERV